jgi:CTP-dependent riboflavin kinase
MAVLSGIVVSGQGDFAHWIEKLEEHYTRKTGMRLLPGTLNILLDYPYTLAPDVIPLGKEEYGGTVSLNLPCRIFRGNSGFVMGASTGAFEVNPWSETRS